MSIQDAITVTLIGNMVSNCIAIVSLWVAVSTRITCNPPGEAVCCLVQGSQAAPTFLVETEFPD